MILSGLDKELRLEVDLSLALYCTALHCTALHCTAMHCTALHWPGCEGWHNFAESLTPTLS
jgi:hypothetical protein